MIKFVLILHLCSGITGVCFDNQHIGELPDHYTCVKAGYIQAYKSFELLDKEEINQQKLAIRFECKELKVEKI
jgi:hypothetical protein|tara:strand:- start:83 stop:301 length:219 start_codon:yes stop_codon:yes gene_type:complete